MFSFRTTPLEDQMDRALTSGPVACFCTQNCWDTGRDRYMYQLFAERGNLERILAPMDSELTPGTNHIGFTMDDLRGLSAVVVEIQDVGSRYFNYTKDVFRLMSMLKEMGDDSPALYVVDHINPAGRYVEGSIPSGECEQWVPKVAHSHGLTLGELCHLYSNEIGAKFPLHVISALASEATRDILPWVIAPASDIPGMFTCHMYSGGGLWNNTSVSPAIGTSRPYEYIGAPFIKPTMEGVPVPDGVLMRTCTFTPSAGRYCGQRCYGYQIMLQPGAQYHSLLHTLKLMKFFSGRYSQFEMFPELDRKLSDSMMSTYLHSDEITYQDLMEHVKLEEQKWIRKAKRFSLYDDQPLRMK